MQENDWDCLNLGIGTWFEQSSSFDIRLSRPKSETTAFRSISCPVVRLLSLNV